MDLTKAVHQFREDCEQVLAGIESQREPNKEEVGTIEFYCKQLFKTIKRYLPPKSRDADLSIPAHILVVDDDPLLLTAVEVLLEGPNRIIVKAETGQDALRHLLREDFAVILLDVRMPQLDGYETAALIRQRGRSRYTPIIFLSGIDTLDTDVVRGLTSGAVDYLVKPVVPEILTNKVSVFVDLYRLREWVKQQALQQSEERFRLLVQGVQDYAIFMLDGEGHVTTWNIGAERLTGYRGEEILGQHYDSFYPNEELASGQPARDLQMAAAAEASCAEPDRWMVRKDATRFIANVVVTGLRDEQGGLRGYAVVIRDITERKRTEDQIQASLKEKEILLREVHHRVKNNLQVIYSTLRYSMLRLQSQSVTDPKVLELFEDSQARVKAMALLHETLYQLQDLSRIDMAGYISKLTGQLFKSYGISPDTIRLRLNVAPVSFSFDTAIACGLLINELVSNSLKHAFPNGRTGEVAIQLVPDRHGTHVLTVSDNGVGLPSTFEVGKAKSLGWQLVPMLVEQLKGTFELHRDAGTTVTLTFSELSDTGRV